MLDLTTLELIPPDVIPRADTIRADSVRAGSIWAARTSRNHCHLDAESPGVGVFIL